MRKTSAIAVLAAAATIPTGIAIAAVPDHTPPRSARALDAPLAGHATVAAAMDAAHHRMARHAHLVDQVAHLRSELASVRGGHAAHHGHRHRLERRSTARLHHEREHLRAKLKRAHKRAAAAAAPAAPSPAAPAAPAPSAALQAIAQCESGGDPTAVSPGGTYRGKYQFTYATWASVGGTGDPAAAPEAEQDMRAALLYARSGPSSWPVCGR